MKAQLENESYSSDKTGNSSLSISLMLQFLFHELRHSDGVKRWLFKKLSLEFDELLTKTTIGKFFDSVTVTFIRAFENFYYSFIFRYVI